MAGFLVRSLDAISKAVRADLRRELPGTDAAIPGNVLYVLAKVKAMAIHLVELRLEWIYRQIFASTADENHLERHAYELGMARKPASRASGNVTLYGAPNTVYPAEIAFLHNGTRFLTAGESLANGSGLLVMPVYSETAGALQNRAAGEALTLGDPALYPSLQATAIVTAGGIGGGADTESDESLRARILDRKRRPPQGGAVADYERFAREVPGVTRAWAFPFLNGPGTIGVYFLFEGRFAGIPTPADVAAVQDDLDWRRMIRVSALAIAPIASSINIQIALLDRDTAATRAAIEKALAAMFQSRARPGVSTSPFRFSRSWISEAVSLAAGESSHRLIAPTDDIIYYAGQIPTLGFVTYS
jgi:uncharacterized phage protein gp47/JayE